MAGIFHPSRGGVRGGQDQFSWEDVKTDKDRENYLGHSVMVPVGKWQEGKDLIWYTRDKQQKHEAEIKRKKEISSIKDLEARAMAAALGHESFSTGTTSLTAKELQEVLSRGQTGRNEDDVVKGMGYSKPPVEKQKRYGTEFVGGDKTREVTHPTDNVETTHDVNRKSSKKRKKEKRKKKKKKKKKHYESEEDFSSEGFEAPHSSNRPTRHFIDGNNKRHGDNERCREGMKRKTRYSEERSTRINDSEERSSRIHDSEGSCSEGGRHVKRYYKDREKHDQRKRKFRARDDEEEIHHLEMNRHSGKEHKRVKISKYDSEDEDDDEKCHSHVVRNSLNKSQSQPEGSRIKFTSTTKRRRRQSSSGYSNT